MVKMSEYVRSSNQIEVSEPVMPTNISRPFLSAEELAILPGRPDDILFGETIAERRERLNSASAAKGSGRVPIRIVQGESNPPYQPFGSDRTGTGFMGANLNGGFEDTGIPLGWEAEGLCLQTDPEAFFPDKGGSTIMAKRVCAMCEVRIDCLDKALETDAEQRFGILGGMSQRERRAIVKNPAKKDQIVKKGLKKAIEKNLKSGAERSAQEEILLSEALRLAS